MAKHELSKNIKLAQQQMRHINLPVNPNPYFHTPICLYGTSLAISQPQPLLFPSTHITLDYDKWAEQPTSATCRSQTPFNFHQLVHIGGQFLGSGYFHNIIQMSVRQAIAHFRLINIHHGKGLLT